MNTILVDGVADDALPVGDRGHAYGDGVFETVLVQDGAPVWWALHLERLQRGCDVLGVPMPTASLLRSEADSICRDAARAVLKIVLTRGGLARGYAPQAGAGVRRVLSLHGAPEPDADACDRGIEARWCELRLARQPRLAGIKHLNRLEQVLARAEWSDARIGEGLLRDSAGDAICATAANLFVARDGRWRTPALDICGVEGTCRAWILGQVEVEICRLVPADVESADEVFVCSSLRGILPLARLGGREWTVGPMTRSLQRRLWREVPALSPSAGFST
jgi:4-amino-4-deoxychorismate lyase